MLGGIIPHHMLAAPLIASFFKGIENREVQTVVLLGPDHRNIADYPISISQAQWETPYGIIQPNHSLSSYLLETSIAGLDEEVFETEHSIFNITPFIKRTFPQAEILPVTFNGGVDQSEAEALAQALAERLTEKSVVIAAVDFSHEVSKEQARQQDQSSLKTITDFSLGHTDSIETDSNAAILTLLSYIKRKGALEALVIEKSDSAELAGIPTEMNITSYATVYFAKQGLTNPALSLNSTLNRENKRSQVFGEEGISIIVSGDVNLGRSVNAQMKNLGNSSHIFDQIRDLLQGSDLTIINLESPLISNCPLTDEGMIFCSDMTNAQILKDVGIDIASLANNHAQDYGQAGLLETSRTLSKYGINPVDHGQMVVKTVKGIKIAILAYDLVRHGVDEKTLKAELLKAGMRADTVIVFFHWGNEYTTEPTVEQRKLARLMVDSGADLVVGNHPHWVQAVEVYKNTLIVYSHGNLVFDQLWSQETREGIIGRYTFLKERIVNVEFIPIWINEYFQPTLAEDLRREKILDRMQDASKKLLE